MAFALGLGPTVPDFDLPGVDGKQHSLKSFRSAKVFVVVFRCNHCPVVIGSENRVIYLYKNYRPKSVEACAIKDKTNQGK